MRRIEALGTRTKKALWFARHFGLELDRLEFSDSNGQKYGWSTSSSLEATCAVSQETPPTAEKKNSAQNSYVPSTSSSLDAPAMPQIHQYEQLSSDSKYKVEAILFLMNKFAVGDAFVHEL